MDKPINALGAEGMQELREEALDKLRNAHLTVHGNHFEFRGSNRITIKSMQIFVEFEFDGVLQKDFAIFRAGR